MSLRYLFSAITLAMLAFGDGVAPLASNSPAFVYINLSPQTKRPMGIATGDFNVTAIRI